MKHSSILTIGCMTLVAGTAQTAQADELLNFTPPTIATPQKPTHAALSQPVALSFAPPSASNVTVAAASPTRPRPAPPSTPVAAADPFIGGSNSLVARAVGSAEGTRTPDGGKTRAYYGHVDPGNRAWNQGSFSYQHGAEDPVEADEKQLRRLQTQDQAMQARADRLGIAYRDNLEVRLNGIDLANQAPLAALAVDGGSYLDRLRQAHDRGLQGSEAVLWARTYAFWDEQRQSWNAPGLGNTEQFIRHDQERRLSAISRALGFQQQVAQKSQVPREERVANRVIFQDQPALTEPQTDDRPLRPETARPSDQIANQILQLQPNVSEASVGPGLEDGASSVAKAK